MAILDGDPGLGKSLLTRSNQTGKVGGHGRGRGHGEPAYPQCIFSLLDGDYNLEYLAPLKCCQQEAEEGDLRNRVLSVAVVPVAFSSNVGGAGSTARDLATPGLLSSRGQARPAAGSFWFSHWPWKRNAVTAVVPWLPLLAASCHMLEEFVYPGGFPAWFRRYRPEGASEITVPKLVVINSLLLLFCLGAAITTDSGLRVTEWLIVTALLFGNALFHIRATVATRRYSPGLYTSLVVYLPLGVFGYAYHLTTGAVLPGSAADAFVIGMSFEVVFALHFALLRLRQRYSKRE